MAFVIHTLGHWARTITCIAVERIMSFPCIGFNKKLGYYGNIFSKYNITPQFRNCQKQKHPFRIVTKQNTWTLSVNISTISNIFRSSRLDIIIYICTVYSSHLFGFFCFFSCFFFPFFYILEVQLSKQKSQSTTEIGMTYSNNVILYIQCTTVIVLIIVT